MTVRDISVQATGDMTRVGAVVASPSWDRSRHVCVFNGLPADDDGALAEFGRVRA
jgi:hypothetical protein